VRFLHLKIIITLKVMYNYYYLIATIQKNDKYHIKKLVYEGSNLVQVENWNIKINKLNSLLKNISDTQYKKYNLDSLKSVPNDFFCNIDSKKEFKPGSLNNALFLTKYYIK
jgi:hypothetical protein